MAETPGHNPYSFWHFACKVSAPVLKFTTMKDILYCRDKSSKINKSLPIDCKKVTSLADVQKSKCPFVVFEASFLKKRKNLKTAQLRDKICFIHFSKKDKNNLKVLRHFDFFDCLTDEDSGVLIKSKLRRADKLLKHKVKIDLLEEEIKKKDIKIDDLVLIDPATECYNWRYFNNRAPQEINRARRHLHSVSFFAIDIYHFRRINELYGFKAGDFVIRRLAEIIKEFLRKEDVLTHWREDEFFIIAPHLPSKDSYTVARRISEKIVSHKFKHRKVNIRLKTSIGVVTYPEDSIFDAQQVVNALNSCISAAKKKGGNSIVLYSKARLKSKAAPKSRANVKELQGQIEKMNLLMSRDVLEMIYGFARAIEAKDSYTGKHVEYTAELAEEIAKSLKLSRNNVEDIKHAAVLHDLGKVGIDKSILSKNGPLNPKERQVIKTHPAIAAEILREINGLKGSIPAILYHHERYDGKGYPLGLKGEEIPLSARIVAIADVYQALTSDRSYRKAYSKKKALGIIRSESGKGFDPRIVKIFLQTVKKIDAQKR